MVLKPWGWINIPTNLTYMVAFVLYIKFPHSFCVQLRNDLSELNLLLSKSSRTRVQNALSFEIRKIEAELMKTKEATSPVQDAPSQISSNKSSTPKNYDVKLQNYGNKQTQLLGAPLLYLYFTFVTAWDQNDNLVKIFVTLTGVQDLAPESIIATNDDR
jgi:Siah interacting protein, N terminal